MKEDKRSRKGEVGVPRKKSRNLTGTYEKGVREVYPTGETDLVRRV